VTLADPACQVRGGMFPSQHAPRPDKADPKLGTAPRIVIGRGASEEGEMYCKSRGFSHVWDGEGRAAWQRGGAGAGDGAGLVCGADGEERE
jgi:hypothetical protein